MSIIYTVRKCQTFSIYIRIDCKFSKILKKEVGYVSKRAVGQYLKYRKAIRVRNGKIFGGRVTLQQRNDQP
jgi:hypothetical protein